MHIKQYLSKLGHPPRPAPTRLCCFRSEDLGDTSSPWSSGLGALAAASHHYRGSQGPQVSEGSKDPSFRLAPLLGSAEGGRDQQVRPTGSCTCGSPGLAHAHRT